MTRWFGPKRVGWGASPRGWRGWAATAVFLAITVGIHLIPFHELGYPQWLRPALAAAALAVFVLVAWLKYEPD